MPRHEIRLEAQCEYENAVQDAQVAVDFACEGESQSVSAFWDGGRTWLARFSPEREGLWKWRSRASNIHDGGLHGQSGQFLCQSALPKHGFQQRGPLRISPDRRYFVHAGGQPFFWLGDTTWNGPLKASDTDWEIFLADRARKGFSVIQFVATQWIAAAGDAEGRPAYLGKEKICIEPAFFRRLDRRVDAINAHGMVAAPVLAWAAGWNPETSHWNPGNSLPEDQLILLVKYLTSRYGAHQAVWILAGDGLYCGEEAARWRRIGRAALSGDSHLATMHPGGKHWVAAEFRDEPWFSFNSYQSGHWNDDDNLRWINEGPPSLGWRAEPKCPHINLEPCYEGHKGMSTGAAMNAHDVRRACYWSLLTAPVAGVTYGAHGVWSWESSPEVPLSHPNTGVALPWREAMEFPGSTSMSHLKAILCSLEWWRLSPRQDLLIEQPGLKEPANFIGIAASETGDLVVIYLPVGGAVQLQTDLLVADLSVECFDPASGELLWRNALDEGRREIDCDHGGDRVLTLKRRAPGEGASSEP